MKTLRKLLVIATCLAGVFALFVAAVYGLTYHISHRLDCERFNIDNIELRTATDIPDVRDASCYYDALVKVKASFFHIDARQVDVSGYIIRNHFTKIAGESIPQFSYQKHWNDTIKHIAHRSLYSKRGSDTGERSGKIDTWVYVLDSASGRLWMEIARSQVL